MGPELKVECPWENNFYKKTCSKSNYPCCGGTTNIWQHVDGHLPQKIAAGQPNVVMGGDGSKFKRGNNSYILIFVDPIARHVLFYRQKAPLVYKGVKLIRYKIPMDTKGLENATQFPFNAAYYMYGPAGIQNGTMIEKGAPIYFSLPHFLGVGKEASDRILGLGRKSNMESDFFTTTIAVEPTLGLTFFANQALQINVQISTVTLDDGTIWFPNIMKGITYVPLAWIQQQSGSSDSAANEWLQKLNFLYWTNIGITVLGILFTVLSIYFLLKNLFGYFSSPFFYTSLDDGNGVGVDDNVLVDSIVKG